LYSFLMNTSIGCNHLHQIGRNQNLQVVNLFLIISQFLVFWINTI
jgi:hypothetical protein